MEKIQSKKWRREGFIEELQICLEGMKVCIANYEKTGLESWLDTARNFEEHITYVKKHLSPV